MRAQKPSVPTKIGKHEGKRQISDTGKEIVDCHKVVYDILDDGKSDDVYVADHVVNDKKKSIKRATKEKAIAGCDKVFTDVVVEADNYVKPIDSTVKSDVSCDVKNVILYHLKGEGFTRLIVDKTEKRFNKSSRNTFHKTVGNKDIGNLFVNVVKGSGMSLETESTPTIVLDDECLNTKDLSYSLMGRVKDFTFLSNLKKVLCNECFDVLKISYLGKLWVLIEFKSAKVKDLFKENSEANSWFLVLIQTFEDFTLGGRITWVEVEGIPFKLWSGHTFNRIASKWGKLMEVDDYDDTNFHSKRLCILTKVYQNILESFKIIFHGKVYWMRSKEVPGWTLEFIEEEEEDDVSVEYNHDMIHSDKEINNCNDVIDVEEVPETFFNVLECQKGSPSEDPFRIYPLLNKDKNIREHKINEEEFSLKYPSGFTPVGNLNEGHLDRGCAKKVNEEVAGDDNSFMHTVGGKENSGSVNKMSNSMGSYRPKKSGMLRIKLMIVVVYAPQEASEKHDSVKVKYEILDHFQNRFDKHPENRARIDICFPNVLSNDQRDDLEHMVMKKEVKKAVWDCGSDKSPGPDGFSFSFFRHFWSTIEKDIFEVVDCFFTNEDMPNGCNSNFIALIPKIIDANMVKDIRPISLIGSLYKVIAKFLTNHIVNVIGDLVNEVQSAFVAE
nr:nucleotide-binding alpha-beta plait domain-containing protein [Tanacetum cinerariifolium]